MNKELLNKFLEDRCSDDELKQVLLWIDKEALLNDGSAIAYDDWKTFSDENTSLEQDVLFKSMLDKIHHQININQSPAAQVRQIPNTTNVKNWLTKAAAVILIPVLLFLAYTLTNNQIKSGKYADMVVDSLEITAPAGSRTVVQLSDGTKVHLNSGSKIKYPRNFDEKCRNVILSGEGFFEVAHDPQHPFIVRTKQVSVKALGTTFNVMSYPENDIVATTLVEGKVVLERAISNGQSKIIETLVPGQHIKYNIRSKTVFSSKGDIKKYVAWKDGLLIFDNSGIDEVADRLGRMFNVEIEATTEIKDYTYTVKFVDETLSQILDLLTKATPVEYVFLPRVKLQDGTYSKQKILLKRR